MMKNVKLDIAKTGIEISADIEAKDRKSVV